MINVKDSEGTVVSKLFTVKVNDSNPLDNKSAVNASSINLGDTINITGAASGGTGDYKYSYYYKKSANTEWVSKSVNTTSTSVSIKPSASTNYYIKIIVTDSSGKEVTVLYHVTVL